MDTSAILMRPLTRHPRWPLYKKVRRHARRELIGRQAAAGDEHVDAYLAEQLRVIVDDLLRLYSFDIAERGDRLRLAKLSRLDGSDGVVAE